MLAMKRLSRKKKKKKKQKEQITVALAANAIGTICLPPLIINQYLSHGPLRLGTFTIWRIWVLSGPLIRRRG